MTAEKFDNKLTVPTEQLPEKLKMFAELLADKNTIDDSFRKGDYRLPSVRIANFVSEYKKLNGGILSAEDVKFCLEGIVRLMNTPALKKTEREFFVERLEGEFVKKGVSEIPTEEIVI
jgi:hypothetical protein